MSTKTLRNTSDRTDDVLDVMCGSAEVAVDYAKWLAAIGWAIEALSERGHERHVRALASCSAYLADCADSVLSEAIEVRLRASLTESFSDPSGA